WPFDTLCVARAHAVARDALQVQDAGAPLRIVFRVGEKREHVVTRPVDDDVVTGTRHVVSPWVLETREACRARSASLRRTCPRARVRRSCRAQPRPRYAPPPRGTRLSRATLVCRGHLRASATYRPTGRAASPPGTLRPAASSRAPAGAHTGRQDGGRP